MNIVVLGASYSGIAVAHNFLQKVIDQLGTTRTAPQYRLVLISPSKYFYWNISAPRAIVSSSLIPHTQSFHSVVDAFRDYPVNRFSFVHGSAIAIDLSQRTVTVSLLTELTHPIQNTSTRDSDSLRISADQPTNGTTRIIQFHALIIATGSSAHSPLLSLHGPHDETVAALDSFHAGLRDASSVIIVGGGPSGVECAGQLATYFNRYRGVGENVVSKSLSTRNSETKSMKSRFSISSVLYPERIGSRLSFLSRKQDSVFVTAERQGGKPPKHITLISGSDRLLPRLPAIVGKQAEEKLRRQGVHIMHNVRLLSAATQPSGSTVCVLNNDLALSSDAFIGATGATPNTAFLPAHLLDAAGYVRCDPRLLRVERAGPRVFAIGDCAAYGANTLRDVYDAVAPLLHNLRNDLWAYEIKRQNPGGGRPVVELLELLRDVEMVQDTQPTQICPITRYGGVGVLAGVRMPSLLVYLMKGRDYRIGKAKNVVMQGIDPYASPT